MDEGAKARKKEKEKVQLWCLKDVLKWG